MWRLVPPSQCLGALGAPLLGPPWGWEGSTAPSWVPAWFWFPQAGDGASFTLSARQFLRLSPHGIPPGAWVVAHLGVGSLPGFTCHSLGSVKGVTGALGFQLVASLILLVVSGSGGVGWFNC